MSWFDQRPDDAMMGSFEAFGRREGVDVRTAFRDDPAAREALIELETGRPGPQSIMASQVMLRNATIW